jgi:hypothetical protein
MEFLEESEPGRRLLGMNGSDHGRCKAFAQPSRNQHATHARTVGELLKVASV